MCAAFSVCRESDRNGTNGLSVRYSAVCAWCAQHYPCDASLTEMEPMGCLCFGSLQCALGVRSIVCAWCVQHFLCVASLTEMESMGCLCFGILQCALGVRSIFRMSRV